jgi:hypothetical protein
MQGRGLTRRAADGGDSARFTGIFLALSFFYISSLFHARPLSAANAPRWAATAKACSGNYVRLSGDYQECVL